MDILERHRAEAARVTKERLAIPIPKGHWRVVVADIHGINPVKVTFYDGPVALDGPEVRQCRREASYAWMATFRETEATVDKG